MLQVALPDTSLTDCSDLRQKTAKMGTMGRALAVFRVERVIIYETGSLSSQDRRDRDLIVRILQYLDTPQYLRKRIFPHTPSLRYAGILPPLRIESHPINSRPSDVTEGELRWGVRRDDGKVDIGLTRGIDYPGNVSDREMTLFRITRTKPQIRLEEITRGEAPIYFGYDTIEIERLSQFLERHTDTTCVAFSREGVPFNRIREGLVSTIEGTGEVLAVFGGPIHGLRELGLKQLDQIKSQVDFWINTIPGQGTETVRLDEAMIASLALLNDAVGHLVAKPGYHQ